MTLRHLTLAIFIPALAACGTTNPVDTPAAAQTENTIFTPREGMPADIPPDIQKDSWARLPRVTRESLDPDDQPVFDLIVNPDSRYATGLRGPIGMWMYSPKMAEHFFPASTYLRYGADGTRDQRLTELAILTAARALDSQYEWSAHETLGRNAGLQEEIIELLRYGRPVPTADTVPGLGEPERTIIRLTRELIGKPKLSSEVFVTAQRLFGNKGLMDLAGLIGHYTTVNYTLKTFDVQRPPGSQLSLPLP